MSVSIERQEPLKLPNQESDDNFDVFAKNSDTEIDENSEIDYEANTNFEPEGDAESNADSEADSEVSASLSPQEIRTRKIDGLDRLQQYIDARRYHPKVDLDMNNSLEDIENEVARVQRRIQREAGISQARNILLFCTSGIENIASWTSEGKTPLVGWHQEVKFSVDANDYDEVLSELYQKYSPSVSLFGPEIQLLFLLISSATIHCTGVFKRPLAQQNQQQSQNQSQQQSHQPMASTDGIIYDEAREDIKEFTGLSSDTQEMFDDYMQQTEKKRAPRKRKSKT